MACIGIGVTVLVCLISPVRLAASGTAYSYVLITARHLTCDAVATAVMPSLQLLRRNGIWFTHAYLPSPDHPSVMASLCSGLPVSQHGVFADAGPLPPAANHLARFFAAQSPRSAVFTSQQRLPWLQAAKGFARIEATVNDTGNVAFLRWLDGTATRGHAFSAWLQFADDATDSPADLHAFDCRLGRLLRDLNRRGHTTANTVFIIGGTGPATDRTATLTPHRMHVPLLVHLPGTAATAEISRPVSLAAIVPLLRQVAGLPRQPGQPASPLDNAVPAAPVLVETREHARAAATRGLIIGDWWYLAAPDREIRVQPLAGSPRTAPLSAGTVASLLPAGDDHAPASPSRAADFRALGYLN